MLAAADLPPIDGPLTVAPVGAFDRLELRPKGPGWALSGTVRQIPHARHAAAAVALADSTDGCRTVIIRDFAVAERAPITGEPRDELTFSAMPVSGADVSLVSRAEPGKSSTHSGLCSAPLP